MKYQNQFLSNGLMKEKLPEVEFESIIQSINSNLTGSIGNTLSFKYVDIGDVVKYNIRGRGKNKYIKINSVDRANLFQPECNYFSECGGCIAQHIEYKRQFEYKTKNLLKEFKERFSIELQVFPAKQIFTYRNRMDFAVFPQGIGLRQSENFRKIIDIDDCKIQSDWANIEFRKIRELIHSQFHDLIYDRKQDIGYLKYITIRRNADHSDRMIIFTFTNEFQVHDSKKNLSKELMNICESENIIFCFNRRRAEVSSEGVYEIIKGNFYYTEKFLNKEWIVPFNSFSQPNLLGFKPILDFINLEIKNRNYNSMIDLFCGNGFFSLMFGDHFRKLYGYDLQFSSIEIVKKNIERNFKEKELHFEKKDLINSKNLDDLEFEDDSILFLDPPRNGIGDKMNQKLKSSKINEIFYISCNPNSQIEDLENLKESFKIVSGLITDPFPHTPHLESVVYLKRII